VTDQIAPILGQPPLALLDRASLFLDFDGTLVELTARPDEVIVEPRLYLLLGQLHDALNGRLAIVSGRSVATLRGALGLADFLLSGSHGLEIARPGEPPEAPVRPPHIDHAGRELIRFAAGKPGLQAECLSICAALAQETGLFLQHGKMLFELRPGNGGKGTAVERLLAETELAGGRPIFIGDDITDEEGFIAAARHQGSGILVGPPRATAARFRLESVEAAHRWLSESREQIRR
jgi:trehalose 6-phosphate phosphatase